MLIFVYGTLKRNEPNYHLMERYGVFEDDGLLHGDYKLVVGSQYFIPFLLPIDQSEKGYSPGQSENKKIRGELFSVTDIEEIDKLEGHPHWYTRETVKVQKNKSKEIVEAFAYVFHKADANLKKLTGHFNYTAYEGPTKGYFKEFKLVRINQNHIKGILDQKLEKMMVKKFGMKLENRNNQSQ